MQRFSVAIVLFLALSSVLASTKEEGNEILKKAHVKCNADPATAVDLEALRKFHAHGGEKPANLGPHALCTAKEVGVIDVNGKVSKDLVREGLSEFVPVDKLDEAVEKCAAEQASPLETAQHIFKCYAKAHRHHEHQQH